MSKIPPPPQGTRFGLLTVAGDAFAAEKWKWRVLCRCDCGKEKVVLLANLRHGQTKSCGCQSSRNKTTHGMSNTPEYNAWSNIKRRCFDVSNKHYQDYGGRGISMCSDWSNSFERFIKDVGVRPTKAHSIERINNNKGYVVGNVKWATKSEQMFNRRICHSFIVDGTSMNTKQASEATGISQDTLRSRINKTQLKPEFAAVLPLSKYKEIPSHYKTN